MGVRVIKGFKQSNRWKYERKERNPEGKAENLQRHVTYKQDPLVVGRRTRPLRRTDGCVQGVVMRMLRGRRPEGAEIVGEMTSTSANGGRIGERGTRGSEEKGITRSFGVPLACVGALALRFDTEGRPNAFRTLFSSRIFLFSAAFSFRSFSSLSLSLASAINSCVVTRPP